MTQPSTLLAIDGIDLGFYSCRALKMTLEPIQQAKQTHRDVNGDLMDWSPPQFRKYKSVVTCQDQEAPVLVDVWPGNLVTVLTLSQLIGPDPVYMQMMVLGWKTNRDEWGAETGWSIELEQT